MFFYFLFIEMCIYLHELSRKGMEALFLVFGPLIF